MNSHLETCDLSAKVNPVDGCAALVVGPRPDVPAIVRTAIDALGLKHEGVAADVIYKPDYFARVLTAERGITLDRLGKLPIDVQRGIVVGWAHALGLRIERKDKAAQQRALMALIEAARLLTEETA